MQKKALFFAVFVATVVTAGAAAESDSSAVVSGTPPPTASSLSQRFAAVQARIARPSPQVVAEAKRSAAGLLHDLEAVLREEPLGETLRRQWRLGTLAEQIGAAEPEVVALEDAYQRLCRQAGTDRPAVVQLRRAVARYAMLLESSRNPEFERRSAEHLARLKGAIESQAAPPDRNAELALRESYDFLARSGLDDELLAEAQRILSRPNQIVVIRKPLIEAAVPAEGSQPLTLSDSVQGTQVSGQGATNYHVTIELHPNADRGEIAARVVGHGDLDVTARRKPVTILARGRLEYSGSVPLYSDGQTVEKGAPSIGADYHSRMCSLQLDPRPRVLKLLKPLVQRIAAKKLAEGDAQASGKVKKEAETQLVDEGAKAQATINGLIDHIVWRTLRTADVDPQVHASTTADALRLVAAYVGPRQLGALGPPPDMDGPEYQMAASLHESAPNNMGAVVAGARMDEQVWEEFVFGTLGLGPEYAEPLPEGRLVASLSLDESQPLQVQFADGRITAALRIRGFEYDGQTYAGPVRTVRVAYLPVVSGKEFVFRREGDIRIDPAVPADEAVLRKALARFFSLRARVDLAKALQLPHNMVCRITVRDGWLALGMADAPKSSPEGPKTEPSP